MGTPVARAVKMGTVKSSTEDDRLFAQYFVKKSDKARGQLVHVSDSYLARLSAIELSSDWRDAVQIELDRRKGRRLLSRLVRWASVSLQPSDARR
jgi:hypothetical protein